MKKIIVIISISLIGFSVSGQIETGNKRCIDCHASLMGNKVVHAVASDDCENCHIANGIEHPQKGVKGFDLAEEMPSLCFICHEDNTKKYTHPPAEVGECLMCHSPHSSDNKGLLMSSPQATLCADCHDMSITEKQVKHKPVAEGTCSSCHDPHQSEFSKLLKAEKSQLCRDCHPSVYRQIALKSTHVPFEDDCGNCHETHSADNEKLLIQNSPDLCYDCHDLQNTLDNAKVVHQIIYDDKGCSNCHTPHASENERLLVNNRTELCLSCHSKTISTEEKILANIGQYVAKGNFVHGAIDIDGCTVCHNPHASEKSLLLNGTFPDGQYAAATIENFDLCFTCHDPELMVTEFSTTATNFRNGELNLHFLHINGVKGRNCNVCHNVHGSVFAHLISDKVRFGNWEMPVYFKAWENGRSCNTGCHAEKKYTR